MSHLGEFVASLVDGELDHDTRDRVYAHLAGCLDCRAAVDAQRALKHRLANLTGVAPSTALLDRLASFGAPPIAGVPEPVTVRAPAPVGSAIARDRGGARGRGGVSYLLAGAASITLMALAGAIVTDGGTSPGPGHRVTPAVSSYLVDHAGTAGELPFTDPAVGAAVTVSLATP